MQNPTLENLARRLDELDGIVRGLVAYLALQTPELNVDRNDERFKNLMRKVSREDEHRITPSGDNAQIGFWAYQAFIEIDKARQHIGALAIPPDWLRSGVPSEPADSEPGAGE